MTYLMQMTYVGQGLNIILEVDCMDISTHNYLGVIIGHLHKVGLAPQSGTSIFDRAFLEIASPDRAHADFVFDLLRVIHS
jgi:hypothetical protein